MEICSSESFIKYFKKSPLSIIPMLFSKEEYLPQTKELSTQEEMGKLTQTTQRFYGFITKQKTKLVKVLQG